MYNVSKAGGLEVVGYSEIQPMNKRLTTVAALYDGQVLRPEEPLDLEPNTRYIITIQPDSSQPTGSNAWDILEHFAGTLDAPADWSAEHDHYLYGTPKRNTDDSGKRTN